MTEAQADTTARPEPIRAEMKVDAFELILFVAGMTRRSVEAIRTVTAACNAHLEGRYRLEVIDLYAAPARVRDEQIVAAPTLVRKLPLPIRRLIGGLSDQGRILRGLQLRVDDGNEVK